jgi:hypothetical protein
MARLWAFVPLGVLLAIACGNSNQADPYTQSYHPPPTVQNPKNCSEILTGSASGDAISVDGQVAGCLVDEVECPLQDQAAFAAVCDAGVPFARCRLNKWQLGCANVDAGEATDAAPDQD